MAQEYAKGTTKCKKPKMQNTENRIWITTKTTIGGLPVTCYEQSNGAKYIYFQGKDRYWRCISKDMAAINPDGTYNLNPSKSTKPKNLPDTIHICVMDNGEIYAGEETALRQKYANEEDFVEIFETEFVK